MEAHQGTTRQASRERTFAAIRTTALDLFDRDGYDGTTVERIATAAGVSLRTFFRYFPRKEAVLFGTDLQARSLAALRQRPRGEPLLASLRHIGGALAGAEDPDEARRRRLRHQLLADHPAVRAYGRSLLMDLEPQLVELAADRLQVDPAVDARPEVFAGLWSAMVAHLWEADPAGEGAADRAIRWLDAAAGLLADGDDRGT